MKRLLTAMATAVVMAALAIIVPASAFAQAGGLFDHLKCYKIGVKKGEIQVSPHAFDPLVLRPYQVPPFALEDGCRLLPLKAPRPAKLCIPVDKIPRQAPVGVDLKSDYLVYKMRCPSQPNFAQGVSDQFVRMIAQVDRKTTTRELLVPAYKTTTPPDPDCGPTAPHQCGGLCPATTDICRPDAADICRCVPQISQACGLIPGSNQCGGDCTTGLSCKPSTAGVPCACG
ncbi:MAG: hypothetical protein EXS68_02255 [Candidatus Ryanbacteria bacterium]|nr:hypothetical protein [Candidatus Ryanbacteria bacterium]